MLTYFIRCYTQLIIILNIFLLTLPTSFACTRIINATDPHAIIVGRTMDWSQRLYTNLWIMPRGIERHGHVANNPIKWRAQYGSIIATAYDATTTDGMNEKGLAAHILWLNNADYGVRDDAIKGLSVTMWAQYYLDQFKNVNEAVAATDPKLFQLVAFVDPNSKHSIKVHLALEDAGGDSAIIEYVQGQVHIYHDRQYNVLTNSPTYPEQLTNLQQYIGFAGDKPLPGTTDSQDRFVRAAYYLKYLPKATSTKQAIAQTISIVRNIAEPFGLPRDEHEEIEPTIWHVILNLSDLTYHFNSSAQLNYLWTNLHNFDLNVGAPILKLDLVKQPNVSGDVTKLFKPVDPVELRL